MKALPMKTNNHILAWILASAILILAAILVLISALYPAVTGSQVHQSSSPQQAPAAQATPLQPDCQALPECGYIRAHTTGQSLVGSGPVGIVTGPVLTPACDELPECGYIRAHIQANVASHP